MSSLAELEHAEFKAREESGDPFPWRNIHADPETRRSCRECLAYCEPEDMIVKDGRRYRSYVVGPSTYVPPSEATKSRLRELFIGHAREVGSNIIIEVESYGEWKHYATIPCDLEKK